MIHGLPQKLRCEDISEMHVGSAEGLDDELLPECFCRTDSINTFLTGRKDVLLGVKGTGKSSVFRLLRERKLQFQNTKNLNQILVPIDQSVEYLAIRNHLNQTVFSSIDDEDVRFAFLWELYILYRIAITLHDAKNVVEKALKTELKKLIRFFNGDEKQPSLLDFVIHSKKEFTVSIDYSSGVPAPVLKYGTEPVEKGKENFSIVNIAALKTKVCEHLKKNKSVIFILIDNIDDFLSREEYDSQILMIQGLVACYKDYLTFNEIKLKLFLRNEVFRKIAHEKLGGYEKISPRVVQLEWNAVDIRKFLADRILYNYKHVFNVDLERLAIDYGDSSLEMPKKTVPPSSWHKFCSLFLKKTIRSRKALNTTETDYASQLVIKSLFPSFIEHYDKKGELEKGLDIFKFIDTHFCMANRQVTPRIILLYFDQLLTITSNYYKNRLKENIEVDISGEYPLFTTDHVMQAYGDLKTELSRYINSSVTHPEWKPKITSFLANIGSKSEIKYREIKKFFGYEDDFNTKQIISFLTHLGVVFCINRSAHYPDRLYRLPILLQRNWGKEKG